MNRRSASAPYLSIMSCGSTTLPWLFDMACERLQRGQCMHTMPWLSRCERLAPEAARQKIDVLEHALEEARIDEVHDRVLDAADVLVNGHPALGRACAIGVASSRGDVKRRKYHDESTNVSMVSVSRRAWAPQRGHVVCGNVGWRARESRLRR